MFFDCATHTEDCDDNDPRESVNGATGQLGRTPNRTPDRGFSTLAARSARLRGPHGEEAAEAPDTPDGGAYAGGAYFGSAPAGPDESLPPRVSLAGGLFSGKPPHGGGKVAKGADLSRALIPIQYFNPLSTHQMSALNFRRQARALRDVAAAGLVAVEEGRELPRFLSMLKFYLISLKQAETGKGKPLNPVLGETFCYKLMMDPPGGAPASPASAAPSYSATFMEQVSHHPPVTCFRHEDPAAGVVAEGYYAVSARFMGTWVSISVEGSRTVAIPALGEAYSISFPSLAFSFFPARAEFEGTVTIMCAKTGLRADITHKPSGFMGMGRRDVVAGKLTRRGELLGTLDGQWSGVVLLKAPESAPRVVFDAKRDVLHDAHVPALQPYTEGPLFESMSSERIWGETSAALKASKWTAAAAAKTAVEEEQRRLRRERAASGVRWAPKLFRPVGDAWTAIHTSQELGLL